MSVQTVQSICSSPGCTAEVHASGMCNPHYLVWYREQRSDLQMEVKKVLAKFGSPADYLCEGTGGYDCKEIPVRWWVRDEGEPQPICHTHTEQILSDFRKNIRRLELKV